MANNPYAPTTNAYERAFTEPTDYKTTYVDRTGQGRFVPMRVLSLGWPRTATMSTSATLCQLGFCETYHMNSLIQNPPDAKLWDRAIAAKYEGNGEFTKADWDDLLGQCQAVTDWPCSAFAEELIKAYPDAMVILHVRPTGKWWKSTLETIFRPGFFLEPSLFTRLMWWTTPYIGPMRAMTRRLTQGIMNQPLPDNPLGPSTGLHSLPGKYEAHNARVKALVPPERLILWGPADGWKPLCDFLGVPIPDGPVPYVNESAEFTRTRGNLMDKAIRELAVKVLIGATVAGVGLAGYLGYLRVPRFISLT